jgi:hypothetical protein
MLLCAPDQGLAVGSAGCGRNSSCRSARPPVFPNRFRNRAERRQRAPVNGQSLSRSLRPLSTPGRVPVNCLNEISEINLVCGPCRRTRRA